MRKFPTVMYDAILPYLHRYYCVTEISPVGGAGYIVSVSVSALDPKKIYAHPVLLPSLYQSYLLG